LRVVSTVSTTSTYCSRHAVGSVVSSSFILKCLIVGYLWPVGKVCLKLVVE
jgi:hypothetical protein